jgi:predicted porin
VLPTFLVSDSRKVGYANPWVRTPVEIYTLVPVTNSDGVDASYRLQAGDFVHTVSGSYGGSNFKVPAGGSADVRRMWIITESVEYGAATVHLSYTQARFNFKLNSLDTLFAALRQFGPQGNTLADKYGTNDRPARFIALGATYDPADWFVMGEWGRRDLHSVFGSSTAWYVSGGYRLAQLTPYLTYAQVTANSNTSDPGLTVSALPPYLAGPASGLNAGLNASLGSIAVQRTISVGARWDLMKNIDFKLQCDHTRLGAGSPGTLTNLQPGFRPGGTVNLFSATIDFVL